MSGHEGHEGHEVDIDHHVKIYLRVFLALTILTVVTVGVYYLHLSTTGAIALALVIATIKASLVACYFMHLISEKKLIYMVLAVAALFFFFELLIPTITESENIRAGAAASFGDAAHEG